MEHRLSARSPLNSSVAIYYNSLGLLQGQAVDVSRHGIFVHTGGFVPPLHALVELVFPLEGKSSTSARRTLAMVVRVSDNGAAFMFGNEIDTPEAEEPSQPKQPDQRHTLSTN